MSQSPAKKMRLAGWGNVPAAVCRCFRPEKIRELDALVRHTNTLLARGAGKSYGDAALNPDATILTERLDRFIMFDAGTGTLQAQAGVTLAQVMEISIPRGFLPPVIPGTQHVTLGGALAANVHGKNQYRDGEFAEHVTAFTLRLASGERVHCTPQGTPDLFRATAGGMGMTGLIEDVTLRLRPIFSQSLMAEQSRVASIEDMIAQLRTHADDSDYMVGWIDHFGRGRKLGRGIFERALHISTEEGGLSLQAKIKPRRTCCVPFFMPSWLLNRYSMALYNWRRFRKIKRRGQLSLSTFCSFFHPLDNLRHWNRLYGKRGFFQYQCLLPEGEKLVENMRGLLQLLHKKRAFSFLAVIKYHRPSVVMLGFSMHGFSLALDLPNSRRVRDALPEINRYVTACGGRVYLAKDATLTPASFAHMYGKPLEQWQQVVQQVDPESRFDSLLARRIHLKGQG